MSNPRDEEKEKRENYGDLMNSLEYDFYNNDLNKLVEATDLGFLENNHFYEQNSYINSPTNKAKILKGNDSFSQSPFKLIKSPSYMMGSHYEEQYPFESDFGKQYNQFDDLFDKEDTTLTVGQMFCKKDLVDIQKSERAEDKDYGIRTLSELESNKRKSRTSRGLKVLSVKVRDIVYKKQKTCLKEVTEALICDNSLVYCSENSDKKKKKGRNKKKSKEEKNVRRRVYDALNVLIAVKVLRGSTKAVFFNEIEQKGNEKEYRIQMKEKLASLQKQESAIRKKKCFLQSLVQKFVAIISLIERNKARSVPANVNFPFLLIAPAPGNDTEVTLEMQHNFKKLFLQSNKEITLYGDLEVLILLNLHFKVTFKDFDTILEKYFKEDKNNIIENLNQEYLQVIKMRNRDSHNK